MLFDMLLQYGTDSKIKYNFICYIILITWDLLLILKVIFP